MARDHANSVRIIATCSEPIPFFDRLIGGAIPSNECYFLIPTSSSLRRKQCLRSDRITAIAQFFFCILIQLARCEFVFSVEFVPEPMPVRNLRGREVIREKIERRDLVPRCLQFCGKGLGFVAILDQCHFARTVPRKIETDRRVSFFFPVHQDQRPCRIGLDRHAAMDAT